MEAIATSESAAAGMRETTVDGARIAYREAGPADAEPVMLVHGYPSNHWIWRHQIEALSRDHRVIAPDLLGWGDSDQPLDLRYDYDNEVERLGRTLDALGLERVNLFAHDYGGFLSLGFTQRHPERVTRLALLNSRAHGTFVPRWYATFAATTAIGWTPGLRAIAARLPWGRINADALRYLIKSGAATPELIESYVGRMRTLHGRRWLLRFFGDYRVAVRPELRRRLGEIECPTAIVWGRRDVYIAEATPLELARAIPAAELTLIDDAGHFVTEESPDRVTAALRELLRR